MTAQQPLVSVCIPAYNSIATLKETVESVLSQTFQNFEILMQDNASNDGTWELMQSYAASDTRIHPQRNSTNLGMIGNWNEVFRRAKSDFILLLSSDDCLLPNFLEACVAELQRNPRLNAVTTDHWLFWSKGQRARRVKLATGIYENHEATVLLKNPFSINFMLFNRRNLQALVGDHTAFRHYMTCDYDLHIRVALSGQPVKYIDERLARYRLHENNLSRQRRRMTRQALLTVLMNKKQLSRRITSVYRFTLLRFLARAAVFPLRGVDWDKRLVSVVIGRLFRSVK